jgi:hypothetical protein
VEDAPGAGEVYGLGSEDRWLHEMDRDRSRTIRRHSSEIGRNEYLVVKKIKMATSRLVCERKRKWLLKEKCYRRLCPTHLNLSTRVHSSSSLINTYDSYLIRVWQSPT